MSKLIDRTGERYGRWLVVRKTTTAKGLAAWVCLCDCGTEAVRPSGSFGKHGSRSCVKCAVRFTHGATRKGASSPEFSCWLQMRGRCCNPKHKVWAQNGGRGIKMCETWQESFECFLADVGPRPSPKHSFRRIDLNGNYDPTNARWFCAEEKVRKGLGTHGHAWNYRGTKSPSPTYSSWIGMIKRCSSPSSSGYANYGGRGIAVCKRWLRFENFLEDMGERPDGLTLDRVDVNGHYELVNCRWTTMLVQQNNRRNNRLLEVRGEIMTAVMAERVVGRPQFRDRLRRGWTVERAMATERVEKGKGTRRSSR
jgi:hypothetical protein